VLICHPTIVVDGQRRGQSMRGATTYTRPMSDGLGIALLIVLVASRPFEVRAWRAGRLSDQWATILIVARFPLIGLAVGIFSGVNVATIVVLVVLMSVPALLLYRWTLNRLRKAHLEPHEFESAMRMFSQPPAAGPSIATVPTVMTPVTSTDCARQGCGRARNDPIHRIAGD
jgi:hypothetical protein